MHGGLSSLTNEVHSCSYPGYCEIFGSFTGRDGKQMVLEAEQLGFQKQVQVGPLTPAWAGSFLEASVYLSFLKCIAPSLVVSL